LLASAILLTTLLTGCSTEQPAAYTPVASSTDRLASAADDAMAPRRVSVDRSANTTSPAKMPGSQSSVDGLVAVTDSPSTDDGDETDPAEVCRRFLQFTQAGQKSKAERLLTKTALRTTLAAGLELEPMGGPHCTFDVRQASFATTQSKVAQVSCEVTEPGADPARVTWMLRKQDTRWRISGLIVESETGQRDLLSFENPRDVARLAGEDATAEPTVRQASLTTPTTMR